MRRLIWGFAGFTYHIVGKLMHWLNSFFANSHLLATSLDPDKDRQNVDTDLDLDPNSLTLW